jgi:hypothetical protein
MHDLPAVLTVVPTVFTPSPSFRVRLQNGLTNTGRVEVSFNNGSTWGSICNSTLTREARILLCNQLGFQVQDPRSVAISVFGEGTGDILIDDFSCIGGETNILQCAEDLNKVDFKIR